MMKEGLVKQVRKEALANCSWQDAVSPAQSAGLRDMFGGGEAATFESVREWFGETAANAWQEAVDARQRFFAAVK